PESRHVLSRPEAAGVLGAVVPASRAMRLDPGEAAALLAGPAGPRYWLHLDVDVLDPEWMPAVDSPDPGGLGPAWLAGLLEVLAPRAIGASVTIYDPDLDPDARAARLLVDVLVDGLARLGAEAS
ncbi:arginase family protein, partial [Agromyces seonyuensis]